uniref:Transmembrane protein 159 n=1 Tax=Mola mola TaxID=94237 RepID=A0A3Q3WT04_MOLML
MAQQSGVLELSTAEADGLQVLRNSLHKCAHFHSCSMGSLSSPSGQYLSSHPVLAQTLLLFSVFAVLPVGLFLTLAVVTFIMSAVVCLLFVGALSLLGVLFGIALFSLVASLIFNMFFLTISNILQLPRLTSLAKVMCSRGPHLAF